MQDVKEDGKRKREIQVPHSGWRLQFVSNNPNSPHYIPKSMWFDTRIVLGYLPTDVVSPMPSPKQDEGES